MGSNIDQMSTVCLHLNRMAIQQAEMRGLAATPCLSLSLARQLFLAGLSVLDSHAASWWG